VQRIRLQKDESSLLRTYIYEWNQFFDQARYLPMPFQAIEGSLYRLCSFQQFQNLQEVTPTTQHLDHHSIIRGRQRLAPTAPSDELDLQSGININAEHARLLVQARLRDNTGQAAQRRNESRFGGAQRRELRRAARRRRARLVRLVLRICITRSLVYLSARGADGLDDYRNYFERAYIDATRDFYASRTSQLLADSGRARVLHSSAAPRRSSLHAVRRREAA